MGGGEEETGKVIFTQVITKSLHMNPGSSLQSPSSTCRRIIFFCSYGKVPKTALHFCPKAFSPLAIHIPHCTIFHYAKACHFTNYFCCDPLKEMK